MDPNKEFHSFSLERRETLFERVAAEVEKQIEDKRWRVGDFLPNEVELAALFGVSQGTVRRALKILVDKGILIRQQGRGTFVADYATTAGAVANRYVRLLPDTNEPDLPTESRVESFEVVRAATLPLEVVRALALQEKDEVIHVKRAHLIRNEGRELPVSFDEHYLVASDFKKLTPQNFARHRDRVLYAFYQNECGVTISSYREEVKAAFLEEEYASRYGIPTPEPILIGRRTACTLGHRPVEYRIQRYMTRRYHFLIQM